MRDLYEAVSSRLSDEDIEIEWWQLDEAISATDAGSPSDSFWTAWDEETARIAEFFKSVKDEPVIKERIAKADRSRFPR